jgi:hypothetical protein
MIRLKRIDTQSVIGDEDRNVNLNQRVSKKSLSNSIESALLNKNASVTSKGLRNNLNSKTYVKSG